MSAAAEIKKLRDATGVSMMQCREALEEAGGDFEKALGILRKKSKAIAEKKAERDLAAGVVEAYVHTTRKVGAMVLLACETDFVARNDEFIALARDIAMHVAASAPAFLSAAAIPGEAAAEARAAFLEEVSGKPPELREKIVAGKIETHFRERSLLDQPFVKNPELTVRELVESATQKFGEKIEVVEFARFALGS